MITQLAVYGFDEETKIMKLESLHPGITIDDIKKNSSFDIIIPENVPTTLEPTLEEANLLNELDPKGIAIGK